MMTKNILPVLRDSTDAYLQRIRTIPVLSREEERRLAMEWFERRDREAGQKLVLANLKFVVKIAREYVRYGFKLQDLAQEGNMGLLHALDRFDPRRGFRLISYAVWWIRAYIQAHVLRMWSVVRVGTTRVQRRIVASLQKAREKIAAMSASEPAGQKQLAEALEVSESDFADAMVRLRMRDVSLDQPLSKDGTNGATLGETFSDDRPNAEEQLVASSVDKTVRAKLDGIYDDLSPRERFILDHRLLADPPATLETVGHQFGVTRERVRQIEERLKGKLRTVLAPAFAA